MGTVDLVIKNATAYTSSGFIECGVAIDDEKIVAVAKEPNLPSADKVIDATGNYLLPGIIDVHCHMREPGYESKEDFVTGTSAAAAGGVTMFFNMPNVNPFPNTVENYLKQVEIGNKRCIIDFNPIASPLRTTEEEIIGLAKAGANQFKIIQKDLGMGTFLYSGKDCCSDSAEILEYLKMIKKTGLYCAFHPCDVYIARDILKQLEKTGKRSDMNEYWSATFSDEEATTGAWILQYLTAKAGVGYYPVHVARPDYINLVKTLKAQGRDVVASAETMLIIRPTREEAKKVTYIAHSRDEHMDAIWSAIKDGTVDFLGSEHTPHALETRLEAVRSGKPENLGGGEPMIQEHGPLWLNEVNKGTISLERFVKLTSENAAKAFKFYPRKGAIQVGSDADLIIVDMKREETLTSEKMYTKHHWTAFEGRKVKGFPTHTIVRGTVVMEEGEILGKPGHGKFIKPLSTNTITN
jgi:dihydroorotase (multifunctional complex type)